MQHHVDPIIIERETPGPIPFAEFPSSCGIADYFRRAIRAKGSPKVSVAIMSHRNLPVVRWCVECVLRFCSNLDFELVLLDNASDDEGATLDFFQSVPHGRKKVIQMRDNAGAYFNAARAWSVLYGFCEGEYIYHLNDDHIITENALQNLLLAMESDPSIGMVSPMSSNVWMGQDPGLAYASREEMFKAARQFNVHNPRKWQERIYMSSVSYLFRREALGCMLCANPFGPEFDYELSLRLNGYRVMLLGDTWIHHEHDYATKETYAFAGGEPERVRERAAIERMNSPLRFGLSFLDDYCAFEPALVSTLQPGEAAGEPRLLAVDVRAGQGLLDLKNLLRSRGIFTSRSAAFTTEAKYYPILYTLADEVFCDRIGYIGEALDGRAFDYAIVGAPLDRYGEPFRLLATLLRHLAPAGQLAFKLPGDPQELMDFLREEGCEGELRQFLPGHFSVRMPG